MVVGVSRNLKEHVRLEGSTRKVVGARAMSVGQGLLVQRSKWAGVPARWAL